MKHATHLWIRFALAFGLILPAPSAGAEGALRAAAGGHRTPITDMFWSLDDSLLVTTDVDHVTFSWDTETGLPTARFDGASRFARPLRTTLDNRSIWFHEHGDSLVLRSIASGDVLRTIEYDIEAAERRIEAGDPDARGPDRLRVLDFSLGEDGAQFVALATAGNVITWASKSGALTRVSKHWLLHYNPRAPHGLTEFGNRIISSADDVGANLQVFALATTDGTEDRDVARVKLSDESVDDVTHRCFDHWEATADGSVVVTACAAFAAAAGKGHRWSIQQRDGDTLEVSAEVEIVGASDLIVDSISMDGDVVAILVDGAVRIWQPGQSNELLAIEGGSGGDVRTLEVSRSGGRLALVTAETEKPVFLRLPPE